MKYYIGIDGGGTKTKFLLADENLNILSEYVGGSCYYLQCGYDGLTRLINEGIDAVCSAAGVGRSEVSYVYGGLAGYDDSKSVNVPIENAFEAGVRGLGSAACDANGGCDAGAVACDTDVVVFSTPFSVSNDSENALAGALGGEPGINIIAGTGSIAAGINAVGEVAKCGGGMHVIGTDEGSAYWISIRLMHEFTKQDDGRHERTLLYDKLREILSIEDKQDLISHITDDWKLERSKMASIAYLCAELYDAGEPTAIRIMNQVVDEFAEMAIALYNRLGFTDIIPVSGTGGVFKMGDRIAVPLNKKLAEHNMKFVQPLYDPAIGALILAKKMESN